MPRASGDDKRQEEGADESASSSVEEADEIEMKGKKGKGAPVNDDASSSSAAAGEKEPPPTAAAVAAVAAGKTVPAKKMNKKDDKDDDDEKPEPVAPFVLPPMAPPAIEGDLKATAVVREVLRMSFRDLVPVATLICVAGAAAQVINLGGTFLLALLQVHDIELIATLFLAAVQFWKLCCENMCKIAVMRNARDVDAGVWGGAGGGGAVLKNR